MFTFDVNAFKMELIKLDMEVLHDYAQMYYGVTDVLAVTYSRLDQYCKLYHFEKNIVDCDWGYKIDFLTGSRVPNQATLYQYVISFNTPEDGQQPYILLTSLIYDVFNVCTILYDRFGMVPGNYNGWFGVYVRDMILKNQDMDKLIKFVNDEHVKAKVIDITGIFYKTILERAIEAQWVKGTAYMLRFMKDHDIYEEREEIRL